jgi:hypothetical protein
MHAKLLRQLGGHALTLPRLYRHLRLELLAKHLTLLHIIPLSAGTFGTL